MCGIAGIIRTGSCNREEIAAMLKGMDHRGPDGEGIYINENIGIGHKRLSIIDLFTGDQPMADKDNKIWITYNGEIYNYKELRKLLSEKGYTFRTNSDTEVVIYAYKHWGEACVERFRGMFAFGIVDFNKKVLFLARDIFGIKPLNYRLDKNFFAFSSEISPLKNLAGNDALEGSYLSLEYYFRYGYIPAPQTIYSNIYKLEKGNYLVVGFSGKIIKHQEYFDFSREKINSKEPANFIWEECVSDAIEESVKAHLLADVPFGLFLSGGIDSTIIAHFLRKITSEKIKAFTISFNEKKHDELKYAKIVAEKYDLELIHEVVDPCSLELLPDIIENNHYGEPFGDNSAIPTYYLSRLARKHVPLVLSGDGGDEIFGGYYSYSKWMRNYPPNVIREKFKNKEYASLPRYIAGSMKKYISDSFNFNNEKEWTDQLKITDDKLQERLWSDGFKKYISSVNKTFTASHHAVRKFDRFTYGQLMDINTYLPYSVLTKVDIASMANGLEVRPPFLDKYIKDFIYSLPSKYKYQYRNNICEGKYILKNILKQDFGEDFVFRPKQGFFTPVDHWFLEHNTGNKILKEKIAANRNSLEAFFNINNVLDIVSKHTLQNNYSGFLWLLLVFCTWHEQNKINFN